MATRLRTTSHNPHPHDLDPANTTPNPHSSSITALNLAVLQRHYPSITSVLATSHFVVLYIFKPSLSNWEKSAIEGTMFICQLAPDDLGADHFNVVILSRRGLENFEARLRSPEDIDVTDEYVILKGDSETDPHIYGLWIFAEPPPSSTANARTDAARAILDAATRARDSRTAAEERARSLAEGANGFAHAGPQGRSLSLRELFGQQREADAGFAVHNHHSGHAMPQPQVHPQIPPQVHPQPSHPHLRQGPSGTPPAHLFQGQNPFQGQNASPQQRLQQGARQSPGMMHGPGGGPSHFPSHFGGTPEGAYYAGGPRGGPPGIPLPPAQGYPTGGEGGDVLANLFMKARAGQYGTG